jgi:hypothetical protein
MKILLGGIISMPPHSPGSAWNRVHYAAGLEDLGHEVHVVEEVSPEWCVDARLRPCAYADSVNRELFRRVLEPFGLLDGACQIFDGGAATTGLSAAGLEAAARDADLLINLSGHVKTPRVLDHVGVRAYIDDDPVYTQLWVAEHGVNLGFDAHDVFFTRGLNIGTPASPIPDAGVAWNHLLPPVVLRLWPVSPAPAHGAYTTIASWSGYKDLWFRGELYTSKYAEFIRLAPLAAAAPCDVEALVKFLSRFEDDPGIRRLKEHGWLVSDSSAIDDLAGYQRQIARSRGEIGIAKNAYVKSRSGWFSDRSAHYLASGRPVLAQATGFEDHVPTGAGLVTFDDVDDGVAALRELEGDHDRHCRAAREFAEAHLDSRTVLGGLLEACAAATTGGRR